MAQPSQPTPSAPLPFGPPPSQQVTAAVGDRRARHLQAVPAPDPIAELTEEIRAACLADETRRSYRHHQAGWQEWCASVGLPSLPATPADVARHLTWYALAFDDDQQPRRTAEGTLIADVTVGSVQIRLAAINKLHQQAGHPHPGDSDEVRQVMQGLRRLFGVRPENGRQPIMLADLRRMVTSITAVSPTLTRDRLISCLLDRLSLTPGQMSRVRWADVTLNGDRATITLPPTRRGATPATIELHHRYSDDRALLEALETHALCAPTGEHVLTGRTGQPLTRQGLTKIVTTLDRQGPAPARPDSRDLTTKQLRDVALLTTGWFAALRRSNIIGLDWRDLTWQHDGSIRILLRRSKTDQDGKGLVNILPFFPDSPICPATALTAWRDHVASRTGADPVAAIPHSPVFCSTDRYGHPKCTQRGWRRMPGSAVNDLIQHLTRQVGLTSARPGDPHPYGGHSLRVGFVTQAFSGSHPLSVPEVQAVTHHRSAGVLLGYHRQTAQVQANSLRRLLSNT